MSIKFLKPIERGIRTLRKRLSYDTRFPDVNHLLHDLRGQAFSRLDFKADHLVSVGCAGTWYFDWIRETFGATQKHTGVEFYSPRPDDLPADCEWIANTAGNMPEIESNTADAVFSGQNLEHLWPEEVTGFYLESNRILKQGGKLVVDSPNRKITSRLNWSHPEHTVELTPAEAVELAELSGFDVDRVEGLWLCEDPETKTILPFDKMLRFSKWSMKNRMHQALNDPDASFIWWVVATKSRLPDVARLERRMAEIFSSAWPERCQRFLSIIGRKQDDGYLASDGRGGVLLYGPYLPVRKGDYTATFKLRLPQNSTTSGRVSCAVMAGTECDVLGKHVIDLSEGNHEGEQELVIPFSVNDTTFGIQFRVDCETTCNVECAPEVKLAGWQDWQMARAA